MTENALKEYIKRRKAKHGTWKAFGEDLGANPKQLQMIAHTDRACSQSILEALGIQKITRVSYRKVVKA